jgi:hypothetical protein
MTLRPLAKKYGANIREAMGESLSSLRKCQHFIKEQWLR